MITAGSKYKKLIGRCALRPLASEEDLDVALAVSEELMTRQDSLELEEIDYFKILSNLIVEYENKNHSLPPDSEAGADAYLRWLMEVNGLKQVDLCKILSVSSGRASEIFNGVRPLGKNQILVLAGYFNISPSLLMPKPILRSVSDASVKKMNAAIKVGPIAKAKQKLVKPAAASAKISKSNKASPILKR